MVNKKVSEILNRLQFVVWDRYFEYDGGDSYFGWIERKDHLSDFVVVDLFSDGNIGYATSSKKYTEEIAEALGCTHSKCKRIENIKEVINSIRLGEIA